MDQYPLTHSGREAPDGADRNLNLVWLKVPDMQAFNQVNGQIEGSPFFQDPSVKCETASSGLAAMLEPLRDLIQFFRFFVAPACFATLALVIANGISISVRERRPELAVMKVLGFRPVQLLAMVLGESVALGRGGGTGQRRAYLRLHQTGISADAVPDRILRPVFHPDSRSCGGARMLGAGAALLGSFFRPGPLAA